MISDFISLTPANPRDSKADSFILQLPDIYDEGEDQMVTCGRVVLKMDDDKQWNVYIELNDNFKSLCEGESYDRKSLIEAAMIQLNFMTNVSFDLSDVYLLDYMGEFKQSLY